MDSMVAFDPIFVNRDVEMAQIQHAVDDVGRGVRRHLALLGLRRIGKTLLLDEVERRNPGIAIARFDADAVSSDPDDFARSLVAAVLAAVLRSRRDGHYVAQTDDGLRSSAQIVHPELGAPVDEILAHLAVRANGRALTAATLFPSRTAATIGQPVVVLMDEFQEIAQLRAAAPDLLGSFRTALDRPGRALFVVAGSRVTAMRKLVEDGASPLFTRFTGIDVLPFSRDATHELVARVWADRSHVADAADRIHRLTGGWPFYAHAVAVRAAMLLIPQRIDEDIVDVAYHSELMGRAGNVALHCQYLLKTATAYDDSERRNRANRVLRRIAHEPNIPRSRLLRALARGNAPDAIERTINDLAQEDFIVQNDGLLRLSDPVFAIWLNVEHDRRDPLALIGQAGAVQRVIAQYNAQHQADRTEMGTLYEQMLDGVARQFKGQSVPGALFGADVDVRLPTVIDARQSVLNDPRSAYGDRPDNYEIEIVTSGPTDQDRWAVECKHRNSAITRKMVERFIESARAIAMRDGLPFAARWIVAPRGIRSDAAELAAANGIYYSGKRDVERLVRQLDGIGQIAGHQSSRNARLI